MPYSNLKKAAFVVMALLCLWPKVDTPKALAAGILFSLLLSNPMPQLASKWSKILLQLSVVGLGFGIGILQVFREGKHSIVYTMIGITFTILFGRLLGRLLKVESKTSQLISFGTAICGASAIAAMAPVIKAKDEEIAVSLATVFTLNAVALILFPMIGHLLHLSQQSFGLWAALAIPDTSSVVGAASAYGGMALAVGVTVKLTRALWITPVVLGTAMFTKSRQKVKFPLFILGFVAAAVIRSLLPDLSGVWDGVAACARQMLVVTLFLIGAGLTREVLKRVGFAPMVQGVLLWLTVSALTLTAVYQSLIG
jgi:uncharacterized integral membrane protein (TIGR00698 family)